MKQFDLIYSPDNQEIILFNNLNLEKLVEPLTIERESIMEDEEQAFEKKKSEIVDYEDEEYLKLKEKVQDPFVIMDAEARAMCGKFQDISDSGSMYFALVNVGTHLKVLPISKWYGFVQKSQFNDGDIEGLEKNLNTIDVDDDESESEHEIDYEDVFDDDEGDYNEVCIERTKELSTSGKKLQGLVECYDDDARKEEKPETEEIDTVKKVKIEEEVAEKMTKEDIRKAFKGKSISVKDLLLNLKSKFTVGEPEKDLIRDFLRDNCGFETDPVTGEKMLKLKNEK